jgi:hypothetical protein
VDRAANASARNLITVGHTDMELRLVNRVQVQAIGGGHENEGVCGPRVHESPMMVCSETRGSFSVSAS